MMRVGIVEAEQELVIYLDLHHTYFIKVMKLYNHYLCILWMSFYHAIFFKLIKEPLGESRMRIMKSMSSFDPGLHPTPWISPYFSIAQILFTSNFQYIRTIHILPLHTCYPLLSTALIKSASDQSHHCFALTIG